MRLVPSNRADEVTESAHADEMINSADFRCWHISGLKRCRTCLRCAYQSRPRRLARSGDLPVQPHLQKYFRFLQNQISFLFAPSRPGKRGVGHRHERWDGMRWTRQRRRARQSQGGSSGTCERTAGAETNGADADGKAVWFWHPLLVSSRRRRCWADRVWQNLNPSMTVTRRIRHRGERGISR
jgi:hypothetical protein